MGFDYAQTERLLVGDPVPRSVQPEPFGWLASQPLRINFGA